MHNTLIILAAGASSRMKRSAAATNLSEEKIQDANTISKALIGVGSSNRPLLDYLILNAKKAGYTNIVLVVGEQAAAFKSHYGTSFHNLDIKYATQFVAKGRTKPLGTADAVFQAMEQLTNLQNEVFTVCNADNLYTVSALEALRLNTDANAFISYDRDGLKFGIDRISRFALVVLDAENYVVKFIEKPAPYELENYKDQDGKYRVSMNIFKFDGSMILPYLQSCPIHPERNEKELPTAILNMCIDHPKAMKGIPFMEHVPDLTSKADINQMGDYLDTYFEE